MKKDDKSIKSIKAVTEEKKSSQKTSEPVLMKKSIEAIKKSKREKRDGSTDSNDSESEGKYKFFKNIHGIALTKLHASFLLQVRRNQGS